MRQGVRLGVDVGSVRIGTASCDSAGLVAVPVETVRRGRGDLARLIELATERGAVELVVGLPLTLGAVEGPAAVSVRAFAARLAQAAVPLPVRLVDERMSTAAAARGLREAGTDARRGRGVVDQVAAVVILQNALDEERVTGNPPGELIQVRS